MLYLIGIMISFEEFKNILEEHDTMQQYLYLDYEDDDAYAFLMQTWYEGFYVCCSSIELDKKDDDVIMLNLINGLHLLKNYDYIRVDWQMGKVLEQLSSW